MKFFVLLPDGAADLPCPALKDRTPFEAAEIPGLDALAAEGRLALVRTILEGVPASSEGATLSLLGFDPRKYPTGRGALEAPALGVTLSPDDVAARTNLITVENGLMVDHSAGAISTDEGRALMTAISQSLGQPDVRFHGGVQYRHLMVTNRADVMATRFTPPHNVPNQPMKNHLPKGGAAEWLTDLILRSADVLSSHPVNSARRRAGQRLATHIWFWGAGKRPALPTYMDTFGLHGAVITAVDLIRALGIYLGMDIVNVPGATGLADTNYEGKCQAALDAIQNHDVVVVHLEGPDEAGHQGNALEKTEAIARFDRYIVGPLLNEARRRGDVRIMVLPDHPTPCTTRIHSPEPVPVVLWGPGIKACRANEFSERAAARTGDFIESGPELIPLLIRP